MLKYARGVFVSPYKNHRTINHSGRDLGMRSQLNLFARMQDLAVIIFILIQSISMLLIYRIKLLICF